MHNSDLGASLFKTWTEEQKREEITKLVAGFRSGLPVGILCKMAETIAGSRSAAKKHLVALLSAEERAAAIAKEQGGMRTVAESFLR